jgi:DNA primase
VIDRDELSAHLDFEAFLEREGLRFKHTHGSSGRQLNIKECPCCGNNKWKVYANANTGVGNCFTCASDRSTLHTFSPLKFIRMATGLSGSALNRYIEALMKETGWRPKRLSRQETNVGVVKLPDCTSAYQDVIGAEYLRMRGITPDYARYFDLRYSAVGRFDYVGDDERSAFQDYSQRIIIPIYDGDGTLVTFQGRDVTGRKGKRYLFPPGLASTGRFLYNAHNYANEAHIVLCEGVFDVIGAKMALDMNVQLRDVLPLGAFGKNLSLRGGNNQLTELLKLKAKGLKRITFLWDGERKAAFSAAKQGLELARYGFEVYLAFLPENSDPNEVASDVVCRAFLTAQRIQMCNYLQLIRLIKKTYSEATDD